MTQTWSEQLAVLLELQKIDSKIFFWERELAQIPEHKKTVEATFETAKGGLKKIEGELKEHQMRLKDCETELGSKETNIKKYETQQMQVKTNKEYSALTHEINNLKADCSVFEDQILALMDQIDGLKAKVADEKKRLQEVEATHQKQIQSLESKAAALKKDITASQEERTQFVSKIDKPLLTRYATILKKREGIALAPLHERTCSGCQVTVTHQTVNEVRLSEKMVECESCGRMLYASET